MLSTRPLLSLVAAATLAVAAQACSSSGLVVVEEGSTEGAQAIAKIEHGKTTSFTGKLTVRVDQRDVKLDFKVSQINWTALTARWDATVVDAGGHTGVSDDAGVPVTIMLARCPGCFTFTAKKDDGSALASVTINAGLLGAVTYEGLRATEPKLTGASSAPDTGAGSCGLICGGQMLDCKDGVTAATCASNLFSAIPRCPFTTTFEAKTCAQRSAPAATGSCTLVCGGQAHGCKDGVREEACKSDLFEAIPRCPHTFEFASGASCAR